MTASSTRFIRLTLVGLSMLLCAALAPPSLAQAQQTGRCIRARVDAPIVLPDGSRHPAGALKICASRVHSPVAALHETRIDGRNVGLYPSRTGLNEETSSSAAEPYLVFQRDAAGDMVLQGYAVPEGDRMRTFLMAQPDRI